MNFKLIYILPVFIISLLSTYYFKNSNKKNFVEIKASPKVEVQDLSFVSHGSRDSKKIALTFDADMTPYMIDELNSGKINSYYNKQIVDILRKENVKATIFVSGMWAEKYPEVTKELYNDHLFEIANHSYSHPRFTSDCFALPPMPSWGREAEITKSQEALKNIIGEYPKFFRFPGGCYEKSDINMVNKHGLIVAQWDAASTDSFNDNLPAIINSVKTKTQNGSIVLFHFNGNKNAPRTVDALPESIEFLKKQGYEFVTMSELFAKK